MLKIKSARLDARAAIVAGLAAGTLASVAQIALWWFVGASPLLRLWRDARLTAAIVLGAGALSAAGNPALVMSTATLLHYGLSGVYALLLAWIIGARSWRAALTIGIAFGMALFVINLYGFTLMFPWFAAVRDWITLVAHGVFGLSAAACYRALTRFKSDRA